jgi:hypothetical protein
MTAQSSHIYSGKPDVFMRVIMRSKIALHIWRSGSRSRRIGVYRFAELYGLWVSSHRYPEADPIFHKKPGTFGQG